PPGRRRRRRARVATVDFDGVFIDSRDQDGLLCLVRFAGLQLVDIIEEPRFEVPYALVDIGAVGGIYRHVVVAGALWVGEDWAEGAPADAVDQVLVRLVGNLLADGRKELRLRHATSGNVAQVTGEMRRCGGCLAKVGVGDQWQRDWAVTLVLGGGFLDE